jgi:hypothetical protein
VCTVPGCLRIAKAGCWLNLCARCCGRARTLWSEQTGTATAAAADTADSSAAETTGSGAAATAAAAGAGTAGAGTAAAGITAAASTTAGCNAVAAPPEAQHSDAANIVQQTVSPVVAAAAVNGIGDEATIKKSASQQSEQLHSSSRSAHHDSSNSSTPETCCNAASSNGTVSNAKNANGVHRGELAARAISDAWRATVGAVLNAHIRDPEVSKRYTACNCHVCQQRVQHCLC